MGLANGNSSIGGPTCWFAGNENLPILVPSPIPSPQRLIITLAFRTSRRTVRTITLKSSPHLPNLTLYLFTKGASPRLGNSSPILVLAVLVAGRRYNQEAQEKVWDSLRHDWERSPRNLRSLLTEEHVSASDRRARFVGVDAYVAAGGTLERKESTYITLRPHSPFLDRRIVRKRLFGLFCVLVRLFRPVLTRYVV
jgi:hypothetical protein